MGVIVPETGYVSCQVFFVERRARYESKRTKTNASHIINGAYGSLLRENQKQNEKNLRGEDHES